MGKILLSVKEQEKVFKNCYIVYLGPSVTSLPSIFKEVILSKDDRAKQLS